MAATSGSQLGIDGSYFADNEASTYAGAVLAEGSVNDNRQQQLRQERGLPGRRRGFIQRWHGQDQQQHIQRKPKREATRAQSSAQYEADVSITHASFVNNWSLYRDAGALQKRFGGRLRLRNSIIIGRGRDEDCVGGLDENIGNLSTDGSCAIKASEDPLLGELIGSPPYHPLLDGSPAIDNADPRFCPEADQLGTARVPDSCDIGAIEATGAQPAPEPIVPPPACSLADQIIAANNRPSLPEAARLAVARIPSACRAISCSSRPCQPSRASSPSMAMAMPSAAITNSASLMSTGAISPSIT